VSSGTVRNDGRETERPFGEGLQTALPAHAAGTCPAHTEVSQEGE